MTEKVAPAGAVIDGNGVGREVVEVALEGLREHPSHRAIDTQLSDEEIKGLAEDIRLNGQQVPIELTADGVIVCGHQRVRALRMLGRTHAKAVVRRDLSGDAAVEQRMISDNLHRRQLDAVAKARYFRRLREIGSELPAGQRNRYQFCDSRDVVARQLGMSGRNAERLLKVLDAPREVQDAVSAKRLSVQAAGKVARAGAAVQEAIAADIKAGKDPEAVVAEHFPKKQRRHVKVGDAKASAIKAMSAVLSDLQGREDRVRRLSIEEAAVLDRMAELVARLRKVAAAPAAGQAGAAAEGQLAQGA